MEMELVSKQAYAVVINEYNEELILLALKENLLLEIEKDLSPEDILKILALISENFKTDEETRQIVLDASGIFESMMAPVRKCPKCKIEPIVLGSIPLQAKQQLLKEFKHLFKKNGKQKGNKKPTFRDLEFSGGKRRWK